MKYTQLDTNNLPTAFYDDGVHGARLIADSRHVPSSVDDTAPLIANPDTQIPADAIEITDEQWQEFIEFQNERKWNSDTNEVEVYQAPFDLESEQSIKATEISSALTEELNLGFTCLNLIKMDADIADVTKLDSGQRLAVLGGATVMLIRDFNNVSHEVLVSDVAVMILQLGVNYQTTLAKKWELSDQVSLARTQADLDLIVWV